MMKKRIYPKILVLLILSTLILLTINSSFAQVPDADRDGVQDSEDLCPNTVAGVQVDNTGCSCAQKTQINCKTAFPSIKCCASDSNPCTDDCSINELGQAECMHVNNGICRIIPILSLQHHAKMKNARMQTANIASTLETKASNGILRMI